MASPPPPPGRGRGMRGRGGALRQRAPRRGRGGGGSSSITSSSGSGGGGGEQAQPPAATAIYPEYETDAQVKEKERGPIYEGYLKISAFSWQKAFVEVKELGRDVLLDGALARNRAMQGDLVALRLNPVSEWIQCSDGPGQCNSNAAEGEEEDMLMLKDAAMAASEAGSRLMWPLFLSEGDDGSFWSETSPADALLDVNGRLALDRNLQPVGRVVQILKSSFRGNLYAGSLLKKYSRERKNRRQSGNLTAFKPLNSRVPHMLIPGHLLSKSVGGGSGKRRPIIMGRRDMNWPVHSKMPWLEDLVYVGHAGDLKAETSALLKEAGIDYNGFSREVEREATDLCKDADSVTRSEIAEKRRVDMRHKRVFTIDPPNARDLDDAVHIELISEDVVEIGVHIADVSSYVLPGSKIDAEAQRRCTTVYLVNETIPMLPRSLCEHQCSLCPGQDRRAFSCIFRMNRDGTLIDHPPWYGKTLIRSCCQLDYLTAQHLIDGMIDEESGADSPDPDHWDEQRWPVGQRWQEVMADTKLMHEVAMCRREKRFELGGALQLNQVKLDFSLGKDGMPVLVAPKASTSSMQMIEELMLLANFIVARKLLLDGEDQPTRVLRHHADPVPGALQQLTGQLKLSGMDLNIWTAGSIHQSIQNIEMQHGSEVAKIVQVLIMGPMRPATYVVAQGKQSAESLRHYALNMACYTHFTSPIRRYADVMVHRALLRILDGPQQQPPSESSVHLEEMELAQALCERINARRLLAKEAEDRSRLVHYCAYLMSLPASSPVHLTAAVISTGSRSFTVHVMSLGLSARLHVDEMEMEGLISVWNKESSRLILTRSEDDANGDWSTLKLELCTQVVVRPTVRASASPIELKFELVGLAEHSTASKPQ